MRVPKYQLIENELRKQLASGKFENGDKFYTEAELMDIFEVSSITVIRALNDLVAEGYLTRQQGKGTFVSRAQKGKQVHFSDDPDFSANRDKVAVLAITRGNEAKILEKLGLGQDKHYYCIEQVRTAGKVPYRYQLSYLPEQFVNPNYKDISDYQSIELRLEQDFNIQLSNENFDETHTVVFPTPERAAEVLTCPADEPAVLRQKTTYSEDSGQIFEYLVSYTKWDHYKIALASE